MWTQEMRDKAAATRAATKQKKEEREQKRLEKLSKTGQVEASNEQHRENNRDSAAVVMAEPPIRAESSIQSSDEKFDWETAPVNEIITRQADMRREYERISQIVLRRQNPPRQRWTCFTQENVELIKKTFPDARTVFANCLKRGEDGRANFRDDGRFVVEDGVRRLKPAFCCNSTCYKVYSMLSRNVQAR